MLHTAYSLADSGHFSDWWAIEAALQGRFGVLETRGLLADRSVRSELDRRCEAANRNVDVARR
ncbi:hypothetical protein FVF58_05620 [Paraburkholderia panacisoli]|jgi:hypothetical protein|uniref:Uncharacterized protein n=1 Tax=Paraburkholderia panacisoli TaxID=2603818 RepID=A0A5B0HGA8_9BURK|nr:hypothetical protein FVF58_05620 [Paraburkholderia panacisoli]